MENSGASVESEVTLLSASSSITRCHPLHQSFLRFCFKIQIGSHAQPGGPSMKLSQDSLISPDKITRYLLVPQTKGDKSRFLSQAGYSASNADQLVHDIRHQVLPGNAAASENTIHGQFFEITCSLTGPNGRTLEVKTIWMKEHLSGQTKFITLIPHKRTRK